jgi:D-amino-acid dehydrogenase
MILEFLAACNDATADRTTERLLLLAFYSRDLMHELVRTHDMDFDYVQNGKLVVHTNRKSYESAKRLMEYQRTLGAEQRALDPTACVELEPALEHMAPRICGAIHTPSEDAGDTYKFCNELKRVMTTGPNPVAYRFGVEIVRLLPWRGRLMGVETSEGVMEADHYVLALGTNAPYLLKPLGIHVPIYPLKGYSLSLPITARGAARAAESA